MLYKTKRQAQSIVYLAILDHYYGHWVPILNNIYPPSRRGLFFENSCITYLSG